MIPPNRGRRPRARTAATIVVLAAVAIAYVRYVWFARSGVAWPWTHGGDYELLAPRMLGIALLLVPYFMWVVGASLADLPVAQRFVSLLLRLAFITVLALALARLVHSRRRRKKCVPSFSST